MEKLFYLEKRRITFLLVFFLFLFLLIIARLFKLTVIDGIKGKSSHIFRGFERGEILDSNYEKLAISLKLYSLFCNTLKLDEIDDRTLNKISVILNMDKSKLRKIFATKRKFIWLKRQVDAITMKKIMDLKIKGIYYLREYKRVYPNGRLCSHVLGITGVDNVGLEGLELYYDKYLNMKLVDKDGKHKKLNLVLTIDKNIQFIVERELRRAVNETKAKGGTIIVMEPSTGYIVAMTNYPDFDPNHFAKFPLKARKNLAILKVFEPGSVFKIFSSAVLYDTKVINDKEFFYCPGYIIIGGKKISCWKIHKSLTFHEVIKESCNVGMIKAILRVSRFKFYEYLLNFGIGNYTGIDLPGEVKGFLRKPKGMGLFSQASISMGQEVGTTGIQLITAACAIYNDGKIMEPKIVKAIIEDDGTIYKEFKPVVLRQAIPPYVANKIKKDMEGVVEEGGTGELAYIKGYSIGGKTGTGEIYNKRLGRYDKDKVNSSFIGFFPADNAKYGILVTIYEPRVRVKTGGKIAAPVFKKIVEKIISYKPIPNKNIIKVGYDKNIFKLPYSVKFKKSDFLPDLTKKNMREVINILSVLKVKINLIGSGISFKQYPPPGTKVKKGMLVTVWFKE